MITLPADIKWVTPEWGAFVVEGDVRLGWEGTSRIEEIIAPQVWAQYDKPCENLRACAAGDPEVRCVCTMPGEPRQVWEVRWPCGICADTDDPGMVIWPSTGCLTRCDTCEGNETVSARATIQVVPVAVNRPDRCDCWVATGFDPSNAAALITVGQPAILLPLDPLPTPGRDFAVIVRLTDD